MRIKRFNFKDYVELCSKFNFTNDVIISNWRNCNIEEYVYMDTADIHNNKECDYRIINDKEDLLKALIKDKWE